MFGIAVVSVLLYVYIFMIWQYVQIWWLYLFKKN
jgi:hypothetical protein